MLYWWPMSNMLKFVSLEDAGQVQQYVTLSKICSLISIRSTFTSSEGLQESCILYHERSDPSEGSDHTDIGTYHYPGNFLLELEFNSDFELHLDAMEIAIIGLDKKSAVVLDSLLMCFTSNLNGERKSDQLAS